MTGSLVIVGLGPGDPRMQTPEVTAALEAASDLVGYAPYLARLPEQHGQTRHPSDNREEGARARQALLLAEAGRAVAVVSSGDPGVFAMASAVFEAIAGSDRGWHELAVTVLPGVSAMLAASARVGAPLGADFCVVSLSDNLKPWQVVLRRLSAAAAAGFVLALYNVRSSSRPWQLAAALDVLRPVLPATAPVVFATAVSRADECIRIATLAEADPAWADMRTLLLVGSPATRLIERPGSHPWVYSPRHHAP